MTTSAEEKAEALSRLDRSREFLSYAEMADGDSEFSNAVVSLCAQSAIAASDAVLAAHGITVGARATHEKAPGLLRTVGQDPIAAALARILRLKSKAQYSAGKICTATDAESSLKDARRIIALAEGAVERRWKK